MTTTVLLIRHESREGAGVPMNALSDSARARAIRTGRKLAEMGYTIDVALSSPQGRALETLLCVLRGMAEVSPGYSMPPVRTDDAFGDSLLGVHAFSPEEVEGLKVLAKSTGKTPEEILLTDDSYRDKLKARAHEGDNAFASWFYHHHGKTIAIASHGGSRLEPLLAWMRHQDQWNEDWTFEPGGVAIVTLDDERRAIEVRYLGNLGR